MNWWRAIITALVFTSVFGPVNVAAIDSPSRSRDLRPFTVADSIAMTHIVDPDEDGTDHPKVSPDGKHFLIVTEKGLFERNVRRFELLRFTLNAVEKKPLTVATFDSSSNRPGIAQPKWLDNEQIGLIGENPGSLPQVYVVNTKTRKIEKVTNSPTGVACFAISRDKKRLLYYAPWHDDSPEARYRDEHGFAVEDENLMELVTGEWNKPVRVYKLLIEYRDAKKRTEVRQRPFGFPTSALGIWLSNDGRYAVTVQPAPAVPETWESYEDTVLNLLIHERIKHTAKINRTDGLRQLMLVDTNSGEISPLIDAPISGYTGVSVIWSADSRSVVVAGTMLPLTGLDSGELKQRRAYPVICAIDIVSGAVQRISDIREGVWAELKEGPEADTFLVTGFQTVGFDVRGTIEEQRFRRAGHDWIKDRRAKPEAHSGSEIKIKQSLNDWPVLIEEAPSTHREMLILDPNPQFKTTHFGRRETIKWTGKRGESLIGGLVYPVDYSAGTRYPLVIQTHGFEPRLFLLDGSFTTAFAAEELANKDVFVLQLSHGPLYQQSELTPDFGPVQLSMLESAIDYLDSRRFVDRNSVALVGFSMTGFIVRYALTHSNYHFAAATAAEGNDWGYWTYVAYGNDDSWLGQCEAPFGGPPWNGNWQNWIKDSISFNYDKIHTPLRLESDQNDSAEVLNEWENFVALKRLRKPVELIYVHHGYHPVVKPWDRVTSQQGNVDWLLFWLKGEEDPDPSKAEQYARWHELKKLQDADKTQ